jgi:signal transduction histidine kinase
MTRQFLLVLIFFWQALAQASTPTLRLEMTLLKDPQAGLSIEQVAASEFTPLKNNQVLGFVPGSVWVRLQVRPAQGGPEQGPRSFTLRIGPNNLEQIDLFFQRDGQWVQQVRGALTPQASRACPDYLHCFALDAWPPDAAPLYLRIEHRGFTAPQIEVDTPDSLPADVATRTRNVTISMVIGLGLLAVGIVLLLTDRSRLLLIFCGFQLSILLHVASNAGLLATAWPSASGPFLATLNSLFLALRVTMTGLLAWAVIQPHQPTRPYLQGGGLLLLLCAGSAILIFSDDKQIGIQLVTAAYALIPFWQLYGAWSARALTPSHRRVLLGASLVYILMLVFGVLPILFDRPLLSEFAQFHHVTDWRLNGAPIALVFLWLTMMERSLQRRTRAKELEALRQQAEAAKLHQSEADERGALIDMLTHELKNPLGTIRFALASLRQQPPLSGDAQQRLQTIDVSTRRMDELVERVANFAKVERIAPKVNPLPLDAAALIQDLLSDLPRSETWEVQVSEGATFRCDRQLLCVVLENLMTNASKYALPGEPVRIEVALLKGEGLVQTPGQTDGLTTGQTGGLRPRLTLALDPAVTDRWVRVEISNGVDPASIPDPASVFDRYYRHPNFQNKSGMGLGLSVAKSIAQKIRGEVSYRHSNGRVFFALTVPA